MVTVNMEAIGNMNFIVFQGYFSFNEKTANFGVSKP
jgi:hypothetical protein